MKLRLARQTFIRQYGEFTYLFGKVTAFDEVFKDAAPFLAHITREPKEKSQIVDEIVADYVDAPKEVVARDFDEFLAPLLTAKVVLAGETVEEMDAAEPFFTYDCENPKTVDDVKPLTADARKKLPATLLTDYFAKNPTLFSLQLDITQACTERCRHCYVPEYNPLFLPYDKICEILDEFRAMGGLHISLSGGECMLHKDIVKIIRAVRERDCTVSLLSNLTVCTDEIIAALVEADGTAQASLYSMSPKIHDEVTRRKGSWLETTNAILRLRAANIPLRISCPCLQINYKGYLDVLKFAQSLKMSAQTDFIIMGKSDGDCSNLCNRLDLNQSRQILEDIIYRSVPVNSEYFNPGKKEHLMSAEEWKKRKACGACVTSMCLNANGDYYPCPGFGGVVLGNCYRQGLREVWLDSPATKRIRAITNADFEGCATCEDRDYCSTCLCRNFNETGDMFKPAEHFCKVAKLNHEIVEERFRKLANGENL